MVDEETLNRLMNDPPDCLKFQLGDTLHEKFSRVLESLGLEGPEGTIDLLVGEVEKFLPKEQSSAGTQNAYVEVATEAWNDCLKTIKSKLK